MKQYIRLLAGLAATSLAACSGSSIQQSLEPPVTSSNPLDSTLQFQVGTANIAGIVGLNALVTLRQNSGQAKGTSLLSDAPTITGPAGFVVPNAPDAYGDAGTNHISAYIPTSIVSPPPQTTFDPNSGAPSGSGPIAEGNYLASSYGFFPGVDANSGSLPRLTPGAMPFYVKENANLCTASSSGSGGNCKLEYIGGPPTFMPPGHTSTQDGSFPNGYAGYTLGITDFQATPVSGSYALNVVIPTGINTNGVESYGNKSTSVTLNSGHVLGAWTTGPTFNSDGSGGGTVVTGFAGGSSGGATEEYLEVVDIGPAACQQSGSVPYYYTLKVAPGSATASLPDNIGAAPPGKAQGHTLCTAADNAAATGSSSAQGDTVLVYGFAVDYPLYSSAFPQSDGNPAPTIVGAAGQDDLTSSPQNVGQE